MRKLMVEAMPTFRPARRSISDTRFTVVVFPFVPVMPMTRLNPFAGNPFRAAATYERAK